VTIAGVLLLLPAAAFAFMAFVFATGSHLQSAFDAGLNVVGAAIFGYAGLATIRRWRGWHVWALIVSWGMIVIVVLGLFDARPPPDRSIELTSRIVLVAIAVFVLIAKRRERKPDLAAVFDD